jgi:3-oxoacyl-[acyl-carrier protein] reductase
MRLNGKVSIVTGAGQGIGAATALKFAREGAIVAVCDLNHEAVSMVVGACREIGAEAVGFVLDVANREAVDDMVADVLERYRKIDVLVNNAGITRDARLQKMTLKQFDDVIDVPCVAGGRRQDGRAGLGRHSEREFGGRDLRQLWAD